MRSVSVSFPIYRPKGLLVHSSDTKISVASVYKVLSPPSYKSRSLTVSSPYFSSSSSSSSSLSFTSSSTSKPFLKSTTPFPSSVPHRSLPFSMRFSTITSRAELLASYPTLQVDVTNWLSEIQSPLEAMVAKSVQTYLQLPSIHVQDEYLNQLYHQTGNKGIEKVFHKVASASPRALEFFFIIRSRCIDKRILPLVTNHTIVYNPDSIDNLAKEAIILLCGHTCVRMVQLSVNKPSQISPTSRSHLHPYDYEQALNIEHLTTVAQKTETVHKTNDESAFRYKFGNKRIVRALTHLARPRELFAVLYAALLPVLPASMNDIDKYSGGDPGNKGKWNYDELNTTAITIPSTTTIPTTTDLPNTVVFYSVGSSNQLVRGLGMGTRIIYSLANEIAQQVPSIKTFTTLSPIPEFIRWLRLSNVVEGMNKVTNSATNGTVLDKLLHQYQNEGNTLPFGITNGTILVNELSTTAWYTAPSKQQSVATITTNSFSSSNIPSTTTRLSELEPLLYWLCRYYLLSMRSSDDQYGKPSCKVAGFHLANGACMYRICSRADTSDYGIKRSAGFMVNYVYSLSGTEGLEQTMFQRAPLYASNPKEVLDHQNPSFIIADSTTATIVQNPLVRTPSSNGVNPLPRL